jgi:hypothetical protein
MRGAQNLFESFTIYNSGMYVELGMRTRHVVQGFGAVVFQMELGDVEQVENVLWVSGVCYQPH